MITPSQLKRWVRQSCFAALSLGACTLSAWAGLTDISQQPLVTAVSTTVKPNLFFVLDDSGSMGWNYSPDEANFDLAKYGKLAGQCNGVAYDPNIDYPLPVNADGTLFPNASLGVLTPSPLTQTSSQRSLANFTVVSSGTLTLWVTSGGRQWSWYSAGTNVTAFSSTDSSSYVVGTVVGWDAGSGELVINVGWSVGSGTLSSARVGTGYPAGRYYRYTGVQPKGAYRFTLGGLQTNTDFYNECNSAVGSAPGSNVFTLVTVTAASAEAQKYANWYAYYRTRMLMMKSSISLAFKDVTDDIRVGYSTILDRTVAESTDFVHIRDFNTTQKTQFYTAFNAAVPGGSTPLRGALSKAGQYYANQAPDQTYDPVQYSCQRNITLLSTDGYWNTNSERSDTAPYYGPYALNNTTKVGQQDGGSTPRPMLDGSQVTVTKTFNMEVTQQGTGTRTQTVSTKYRRNSYATTTSGCSGGRTRLRTTVQERTASRIDTWRTPQQRVGTYTRTLITINGDVSEDSNSATVWRTPTDVGPAVVEQGPTSPGSYGVIGSSNSGTCAFGFPLPSPNPSVETLHSGPTGGSLSASNFSGGAIGTAVELSSSESSETATGSEDSLADVAMYFYKTDLRTSDLVNCSRSPDDGTDLCRNTVKPGTGDDNADWQHMKTYTLGLGVSGTLTYDPNYLTATAGDFFDLKNGNKNWPIPGNGASAPNVDDLWHAAVNGRGKYFSAKDPTSLANSLQELIVRTRGATGAAAGGVTSSQRPVSGDNFIFVAQFVSEQWTGDLKAFELNLDASKGAIGGVDNNRPLWAAGAVLDARDLVANPRSILFFKSGASNNLSSFDWANLGGSLQAHFSNACGKSPALTQCASLNAAQTTAVNDGATMVSYLKGAPVPNLRDRLSRLGDFMNAAPVYVGAPRLQYTDAGYASFKTAQASRQPLVYAAGNDGMLHAFNARNGQELWAYVPTMVMPQMFRLADKSYATQHRYLVDGTPVVADVYVKSLSQWRTVLIGGLRAGGAGLYALDVTDPANPKGLWEFTHADLGLTFGTPVVAKRRNGDWVVAFTSGYNNVGDGNGHLFVLDAYSGAMVPDRGKISTFVSGGTPAGTASNPSGLGPLTAWVDLVTDNTALRLYAGDLLGNLWRFDIDEGTAGSAVLLAQFVRDGKAQSITTTPQVALIDAGGAKRPVVFVGTGRLLGATDLSNRDGQTVYAVQDKLAAEGLGDVRAGATLVAQTVADVNAKPRTTSKNAVDWSTKNGWYLDLVSSGERVNVDPFLIGGTLVVAGNVPSSGGVITCESAGLGSAWVYSLNVLSGGGSADHYAEAMLAGVTAFRIGDTNYVQRTNTKGELDAPVPLKDADILPTTANRTSWRELVD